MDYSHTGLRGNPLIHYHVGGLQQAVAVPEGLHIGSGGVHNNEKYLSIWHNGFYQLP